MKPLVWIIDEEWSDYDLEKQLIYEKYPNATIKHSGYDYLSDYQSFGRNADVVLAQVYTEMPADIINGFTNCKGIAIFGGGYDRIDVEAARKNDIPVTNVKGYCAEDIANYVLTAILVSNKSLSSQSDKIKEGLWGLQAMEGSLAPRINEQTVMIIGLGKIGRTVAKKLQSVGMSVISYDPHVHEESMNDLGIKSVELMEGLKIADYVSIHCNLMDSTTNLIGKFQFESMKKTSVLINTARGKVINESELIDAVNKGEIAGAVLDVVNNEPLSKDSLILHTDNVMVTPHISYLSEQSINELKHRTVGNALDMYHSKRPADVVNY